MAQNLYLLVGIGLLIALPLAGLVLRRRLRRIAETKKRGKQLNHYILGWRPSSRRIVLKQLPMKQGRAIWTEGEDVKWDVRAEPGFTQTLIIEETGEVGPCVCVDLDRKVVIRYEVIEEALAKPEPKAEPVQVVARPTPATSPRAARLNGGA